MLFLLPYLVPPSLLLVLQSSALLHPIPRQNRHSHDACTPLCEPYDTTLDACMYGPATCFCTAATEANMEACINCHLKLTPTQKTVNTAQEVLDEFQDICGEFGLPAPKVTFPAEISPTITKTSTTRTSTSTAAVTGTAKITTTGSPTSSGSTAVSVGSQSESATAGSTSGASSLHIVSVVHAALLAAVLSALM